MFLLPLLALGACDKQKAEQPQAQGAHAPAMGKLDRSQKGGEAPATPFLDPAGAPATLSQFRGRPLMVNLWATWCVPCVAEMPQLDRLAVKEKDRFQLIVVSQDLEGKRAVEPFFTKHKFQALQPYLDKENVLPLTYKAQSLPITVFYDADGKEQWRILGAMNWESDEARKLLDETLR